MLDVVGTRGTVLRTARRVVARATGVVLDPTAVFFADEEVTAPVGAGSADVVAWCRGGGAGASVDVLAGSGVEVLAGLCADWRAELTAGFGSELPHSDAYRTDGGGGADVFPSTYDQPSTVPAFGVYEPAPALLYVQVPLPGECQYDQ